MNAFSIYLAIGAALGLYQVYAAAPPKQAAQKMNLAILALFGALLGARLGYAALHWSYFQARPLEIAQVWLGGLTWWGALAGAVLTILAAAAALRLSFAVLADALSPLLPGVAAASWLGCSLAGCAYGPLAPAGAWWGLLISDETGQAAARFPLPELAALTLLFAFGLLINRLSRVKTLPPGRIAALSGLLLGAHTLLFSIWIAAPGPSGWFGLRPGVLAALILSALCALSLLVNRNNKNEVDVKLT